MNLRRFAWLSIVLMGPATTAHCSSFDEGERAPDGGAPDGGALDAPTPISESGIAPDGGDAVLVSEVGGTLGGFGAGAGGVAWSVGDVVKSASAAQATLGAYTSSNTLSGFLTVSGGDVFFTRAEAIVRCQLGGECGPAGGLAFGLDEPGAIALSRSDGQLYVAERSGRKRLLRCAPANCANATAIAVLADAPIFLAPAGARIFLGYASGVVEATTYAPSDAGAAPIATVDALAGLVADGDSAYWIEAGANRIVHRRVASGEEAPIPFAVISARDLTLAGDDLYWLETSTGTVRRCRRPACATAADVVRLPGATRLAVGDRVYLSDGSKIFAYPL
ncbi:MAG: hypothetical protein KF819_26005 [Labilithrix sp.]|nr:hypothetical protein [Labilithrix sp.]